MSADEENSFFNQIRNGIAWAVGAQVVVMVVGLVVLYFNQAATAAKVEEVRETVEAVQVSNAANYKSVTDQITALNTTTMSQGFQVSTMQSGLGEVRGKLDANLSEDNRQWDSIRANEYATKAALTLNAFNEWRLKYERETGTKTPSVSNTQ